MTEIKISELSIGDWVVLEGQPFKVIGINPPYVDLLGNGNRLRLSNIDNDNLSPIPLTPEILEKNGWSKEYDDVWECGVWRISQTNKCLFVLYNEKYDYDFCVYIDTVRQLQHALRLAGVEKEIVL